MHAPRSGKALFFKTMAFDEDQTSSTLRLAPNPTTLLQAAEFLRQKGVEISQTQWRKGIWFC
jgi:hypothetical protein